MTGQEGGEKLKSMALQVRKKDSRLEDFDRSKIVRGLIKAGASSQEAENVASQVESWSYSAAKEGTINSSEVKAKAIELLQPMDPKAAAAFQAYTKPS